MAKKKNRNDDLLEDGSDLQNEVKWSEYEHKKKFSFLCNLEPNKKSKKLVADNVTDSKKARTPCVYVMVVAGRIFKIGVAAGTKGLGGFLGRVGSYNAGAVSNRISGTASTTNYWVLHSLLNIEENVDVYAIFSDVHISEIFGEQFTDYIPTPKGMEGVIIRQFEEKYGKKPIGNTQG